MTMIPTTSTPDDQDGQRRVAPPTIGLQHMKRYAIVYIRQSSAEPVRHPTGPTQAQRDLAASPRRLGRNRRPK